MTVCVGHVSVVVRRYPTGTFQSTIHRQWFDAFLSEPYSLYRYILYTVRFRTFAQTELK